MKKRISLLLAVLILLASAGCTQEVSSPPIGPEPNESIVWEAMPQLTYGVMEYEKLEVLPWYSGRCEATSLNTVAETKAGFYQTCALWLFYADKTSLSNWIPVCNDPTCTHYGDCNAHIASGRFLVGDHKIYYEVHPQEVPVSGLSESGGFILASKNPDGTFHKVEYILEDMLVSGKSASSSLLLPDQWLCQRFELEPNGTQSGRLYCVTKNGPQLLAERNDFDPLNPPPGIVDAAYQYALNGDRYFSSGVLDDTGKTLYRVVDGQLKTLDVSGLTLRGAYISGNTLRFFRPGEGYYDRNTETGEETFLSPPHLENSYSCIMLPNCILESSLMFTESLKNRPPRMLHKLAYFDGIQWHDVLLPEELEKPDMSVVLAPLAITADSILFCSIDMAQHPMEYSVTLYAISLDAKEKTLEYVAEIVPPQMN